jgi:predicted DNA-binding protein
MLIEVVGYVEEQLRDLSRKQGKDVGVLVKDAIREYLEAMAITDLDAADIATAQVALAGELRGVPPWKDGDA